MDWIMGLVRHGGHHRCEWTFERIGNAVLVQTAEAVEHIRNEEAGQ